MASEVLVIEPNFFEFNPETAEDNAFMNSITEGEISSSVTDLVG